MSATLTGPAWLSGGVFGVEDSVVAVVFCLIAGLGLLRLAARRGAFEAPMWRASDVRGRPAEARLADQTPPTQQKKNPPLPASFSCVAGAFVGAASFASAIPEDPREGSGGIWSPGGVAVDEAGQVYATLGNSPLRCDTQVGTCSGHAMPPACRPVASPWT